jgi:transcriptional regulator with XRE-family HTH domain
MVRERYDVWLRRERERRAWTQERVATELQKLYEDSSATAGEIGRWERGVRIPRSSYREWLCKLYEADPSRIQWSREEGRLDKASGTPRVPSHPATVPPSTGSSDSPALLMPTLRKGQDIEQNLSSAVPRNRTLEELGEAPDIGEFYGREEILTLLQSWIVSNSCRIVAILGLGGIGKTALAVKVASQVKYHFDCVLWRNLRDAPPLEEILKDCILFFSKQEYVDFPKDEDGLLLLLIQLLRTHRCLLVLDNIESVLEGGQQSGHYREGYEGYGKLIRRIAESSHQSCFLLTSREKLQELIAPEGNTSTTRSLYLYGLSAAEGKEILKNKGLIGSSHAWDALIHHYGGNPLALKLVAEPILELFGGDVSGFVGEDFPVDDVYEVLSQQFLRLSELEQHILYWLAIEREAVSIGDLQRVLVHQASKKEITSALMSLRHRSMIEKSGIAGFTLQPVIMEYLTDQFLEKMYIEVATEQVRLLSSHALMKAQSKDYVRDSQIRLIVQPLASRLQANVFVNDIGDQFRI